jgi:AsmA family
VSETYSHAAPRAESLEPTTLRNRIFNRWPIWILLVLLFLWMLSVGISLVIQHSRLQSRLTAKIEAAFGRPVQIGTWKFSFWGGPALEADSITVGEDPRFGHEYFLRAESMAVRLRWQSLLRGRLEIGTLSFTRPSLNLVRNATGEWNVAEWLPRPAGMSEGMKFSGRSPAAYPAWRFRRIDVDGGRIDFKVGDEKLPLAFVGVNGAVETDSPGRWRIGLEATPWRAAVVVQQAGTIYVSGHVGGTSSRLRPATLDVSWTDASVSDVLRLARGDDYGVRGALALSIRARTQEQNDGWAVQGRAELRQIHRWDLALRPDNPSVNLIVRTKWRPAASSVDLTDVTLEAPHSNAHASGRISWKPAGILRAQQSPPIQLEVSSAKLDFGDLLAWIRAFHPGVADSLSIRGLADVRADLFGWPLRVENAVVSSDGADLSGAGLRRPARLTAVQFRYNRGIISAIPVTLSWGRPAGPPDGSFRFDIPAKPPPNTFPAWHVVGSTSQMRDLIALAGVFGWNLARGWDLRGPFRCDLQFAGAPHLWPAGSLVQSSVRSRAWPVGWIELGAPGASAGGASIRAPFLNHPVEQLKARADLTPGERHITLASAQAFGTHWRGSFDRRVADAGWQFALSGDHLAAADLDLWLDPRWRESFLGRMLPFLIPRSPANVEPEHLAATGRLSLGQFTLAPFDVRRLQGNLQIAGRHIELAGATGQFYGGTIGGSFVADLQATPIYHATLNFARLDMPALLAAAPSLGEFIAESASGQISLDARGATRADLIASLTCEGNTRVAGLDLRKLDLWKSLGGPASDTGPIRFPAGSATFSCSQRKIEFQSLQLVSGLDSAAEGSGTVDFSHNLDLRFQVFRHQPGFAPEPRAAFRLTGSFSSPQIARISAPPPSLASPAKARH